MALPRIRFDSLSLRRVLLSVLVPLVLCCLAHGSEARIAVPTSPGNPVARLPVIDKHDIHFTQVSVNGASLQGWINATVQDNYGFLWFGTSDGLYRYDGYSLRPYRHEPGNLNSASGDSISTLYKDRDGSIWIGTGNGLDRLNPSQGSFTHYRHESRKSASLANDSVTYIYRDRSGELWIGTVGAGLDRLEPVSGTFVHYVHNPRDAGSLSNNTVSSVFEDRGGNLWIGTAWGLNKLDRATGRFSRYLTDPANPNSIGHNYVGSILEDRSGVLWLSSPIGNGLSALNLNTGEFTRYSFHAEEPSSQSVVGATGVFEDRDGTLWVGTVDRGLLKLDRERKTFTRYANEPGNPNSLPNDSVQSIVEDAEGEMWVGTASGLSRFQGRPPPFVNYQHEAGNPNSLHSNSIWSVQSDSSGIVWIGSEDGLDRLDQRTGKFTFYQHDSTGRYGLSYNKVSAAREDRSGTLWVGTYGGGLDRFDRATGRFFAYRHDPKDTASLSSDAILSLLIDRHGALWVGTQGGGLNRFDSVTGRFTAYMNDLPDPGSTITVLFEDRAGMLWAGGSHGLTRLDPKTGRVTAHHHNSEEPQSLSGEKVNAIREDRNGRLWIGTGAGLDLLDRSRGTVKVLTTKEGLPDNAIESIQEDRHGYLWLGTHNGLSRFDPERRTFHNYSESDGLASNLLNPHGANSTWQTQNGQMIFGSSNGVTVFYPDRISENHYIPPVELTDFLLFNRRVRPSGSSPLSRSIWATNSLTLTHLQSIFTLEFAALSYVSPAMNHYRYRLEGLETQWNEVGSDRRDATYTNLNAGKYLFRLQGSNNDRVWNNKGVALAIIVLPPWWATWWFNGITALIILGLIWGAYRSRVKSLQLQTARLESQVAQRTYELQEAKNVAEEAKDSAEQANQAKTIFLASMSHELRTPLNAILGFSHLVRESGVSKKQRRDLDIVNRSGEHLLSLINDVLDMAKIDSGRIVVEAGALDSRELVRDVMDLMRVRAAEKGLELTLEQSPGFCQFIRTDGGKLRQVLINLVGNAVKYTERGRVTLHVDGYQQAEDSQYRLIAEVQDTGIGIAADEQARIFEPFLQARTVSAQKGTGLGLAISKKYIELMGGTIRVESELGRGSLFRVEIPVLKVEAAEMPSSGVHRGRTMGLEPGQPELRVLIVEDQVENSLLLETLLENAGFRPKVAEDGVTGIETFINWRPHFIWMDWRLPDIDGLAVTRRIRELDGGRDVKIVMLSASAFTKDRTEALAAGVDDFVRKPFQPEEIFDCLAHHLGVRYLYQAATDEKTTGRVGPEELADLPPELRTELADAVVSLDIERIAGVIGRIAEKDAALGSTLSQYAERYAYSSILQALRVSSAMLM